MAPTETGTTPGPVSVPQLCLSSLSTEILRSVFSHCNRADLCELAVVCKRFHELASADLYKKVDLVLGRATSEFSNEAVAHTVPQWLDTLASSSHNYPKYMRTLALGVPVEPGRHFQQEFNSYSCAFACALLKQILPRADNLEEFSWNVAYNVPPEIYRMLHQMGTLSHVRIQLPKRPKEAPASSSTSASAKKPVRDTRRKTDKQQSIGGFRNLKTIAVGRIDTPEILPEIRTCLQSSAGTLKRLNLSFSDRLWTQIKNLNSPPAANNNNASDSDSDDEDGSANVTANTEQDPPEKLAECTTALAKILGIENKPRIGAPVPEQDTPSSETEIAGTETRASAASDVSVGAGEPLGAAGAAGAAEVATTQTTGSPGAEPFETTKSQKGKEPEVGASLDDTLAASSSTPKPPPAFTTDSLASSSAPADKTTSPSPSAERSDVQSESGSSQDLAKDVIEYSLSTRGLALKALFLEKIPVKASVLYRGIDLTVLQSITLRDVGSQVPIWRALAAENKRRPLALRSIHTDHVTKTFLKFANQLSGLRDIYLVYDEETDPYKPAEDSEHKRHANMKDITRYILRKHAAQLRTVLIDNHEDNSSWDFDNEHVKIVARSCPRLEELAVSMDGKVYHTLLKQLPQFTSLHALRIINLRNDDTCSSVLKEFTNFALDVLACQPWLKLKYLAVNRDEMTYRITRTSAKDLWLKEMREEAEARAKARKAKATAVVLNAIATLDLNNANDDDLDNVHDSDLESVGGGHSDDADDEDGDNSTYNPHAPKYILDTESVVMNSVRDARIFRFPFFS